MGQYSFNGVQGGGNPWVCRSGYGWVADGVFGKAFRFMISGVDKKLF